LRLDLENGRKHYYAESFRSDALLPYDAPNGFPVDTRHLTELVGALRVRVFCSTNADGSPKLLNAEAIENAKTGLVNDIKRASDMGAGGMSLDSALKDQGLDADTLAGVNNAIVQAAKAMNLSQDTTDSLTKLIKPLAHSVLEPKL
jgi:hypothetical protein